VLGPYTRNILAPTVGPSSYLQEKMPYGDHKKHDEQHRGKRRNNWWPSEYKGDAKDPIIEDGWDVEEKKGIISPLPWPSWIQPNWAVSNQG